MRDDLGPGAAVYGLIYTDRDTKTRIALVRQTVKDVSTMSPVFLSPITDFVNMIAAYFAEIWGFLIFLGNVCSVTVVLVGAILWFTETNASKGKALVMSGILLAIVVQYFVLYPPAFVVG